MPEELWHYALYLAGGILAGGINTLSGGGNNLTFSIMLLLGLPANIANGTNRLGILIQNFWGSATFYRNGLLDLKIGLFLIPPSVMGAVWGAFVAVDIDVELLENIVGGLMLLLIPTIFKKSKPKVKFGQRLPFWKRLLVWVAFLGIGFYGGLVQGGIALVIVPLLAEVVGMSFIRANAIKMLITLVYTLPVFGIFVAYGQVDWWLAILLSVGQVIGTWIATDFALNNPNANKVARWLLAFMLTLTVIQIFDLWQWAVWAWEGIN
ncbi:MAG: sulfite exporter TauE/SafE family protein [Bernardetiaceae bacterium]